MRTCGYCGNDLAKGKRQFCSRLCSTRAWRAKNIENIRARDRENYARDPKAAMARTVNWRLRNPGAASEASERSRLKTMLGLTLESVQVVRRSGMCPICLRSLAGLRGVVDHDHTTGAVRGVLCNECNLALGLFNDDWQRLFRSIQYLSGTRTNREQLEVVR